MGVVPESTASYANTDSIITCETGYASYRNQTTIDKIPSGFEDQSAVLVHDFNGSTSTSKSLVHTLVQNGVGAVYFSSDCCWNSVTTGAVTVGNVAAAVASG